MGGRTSPARRGRPPKDVALDTRTRILEVALDLFARQGFAGTSIRQIARALDLRESALYGHFDSKRAIYDCLLAEAGPSAVPTVLARLEPDLLAASPAVVIRELVRRVMRIWDEPRVRCFMDVFLREGGYGSEIGRTDYLAARDEAQRQLGTLFRRWMDADLMRRDFRPEFLAWELFSPVAYIRLLYLHGQATDAERRAGHRRAEEHVDFFIACTGIERGEAGRLSLEKGPRR
jgi:AcrR family transcriptional regulator